MDFIRDFDAYYKMLEEAMAEAEEKYKDSPANSEFIKFSVRSHLLVCLLLKCRITATAEYPKCHDRRLDVQN
jgi:hypothetical protein